MEELQALKGIGTPQEDQQSQLTWTLEAPRIWITKQRTNCWAQTSPFTCSRVQHGLHVGPEQLERGYPQSCCLSVRGMWSSGWAALSGLSGRRCV